MLLPCYLAVKPRLGSHSRSQNTTASSPEPSQIKQMGIIDSSLLYCSVCGEQRLSKLLAPWLAFAGLRMVFICLRFVKKEKERRKRKRSRRRATETYVRPIQSQLFFIWPFIESLPALYLPLSTSNFYSSSICIYETNFCCLLNYLTWI